MSVFYVLYPCSSSWDADEELYLGDVFEVKDGEREVVEMNRPANLYAVYVPVELATIREQASVDHSTDFNLALEKAIRSGLCVAVAGGQGVIGFHTNAMKIPVVVAGESLLVTYDDHR